MTTLDVRDLSVEVGGLTVVSDLASRCAPATRWAWSAATAPARPACCGCSAARTAPAAGSCRRARIGYLRQDPRRTGPTTTITGLATSSAARASRSGRPAREARLQLEESPPTTSRAVRAPEEEYRTPAATRPSRRCAASPPASAWRPTASTSRSARSPAVSAGGSSSRASCSPGATCCCSTSRRTTSTSTPRTG